MGFELAEQSTEGEVLVGRRMLVGEEQHLVLHQQPVDLLGVGRCRLGEADPADLGSQRTGEPVDVESLGSVGHGRDLDFGCRCSPHSRQWLRSRDE